MILGVNLLCVLLCGAARGDILEYYSPGSKRPIMLQGKVTTNPGRTVSFRHPKFGTIHFGLKNVRYYKVPTTKSIARNNLSRAQDDVEESLEAARWALHHGLLSDFNKAASQAWKLDHNHPTLKRLVAMKQKMKVYLPESTKQEEELREITKSVKHLKLLRSKHFLLLHDCPTPVARKYDNKQKSRAEERLNLLEMVYESFLLKYCIEGVELDVPRQRMMVVLFADREDYLAFSKSLDHDAETAAGYFHKVLNISVFYDQSTNKGMLANIKFMEVLQKVKKDAIRKRASNTKDIVRLINALDLIIKVDRENQDIEVVSHETAHQMAGNTGLQPNDAAVPTWAAEGLATYFESPKEAAWAGIGIVNERRLTWYRMLEKDLKHSNIDFIVSNRIFMDAGSNIATIHAYGQAWALTHFLMDRHFDKLMEYYKLAAKQDLEKCKKLDKKKYYENCQADFDAVFGKDKTALTCEWRVYMNSLETDLERVIGQKKR